MSYKKTPSLNLGVMLLSKPKFHLQEPVVVLEKEDSILGSCPPSIRNKIPKRQLEGKPKLSTFLTGLGFIDNWVLPKQLHCYVGENISCYISLKNNFYSNLKNIYLEVFLDINNGMEKVKLMDLKTCPLPIIKSKSNYDFLVDYTLNKQGLHSLIFKVKYTLDKNSDESQYSPESPSNDEEEVESYERKLDFTVRNPLTMKDVKVYNMKGKMFVQLDLLNSTNNTLFVESLTFDQSIGFKLKDHSTYNEDSKQSYEKPMLPQEKRRFLFELEQMYKPFSKKIDKTDEKQVKFLQTQLKNQMEVSQITIGKITLKWKGIMGESGSLHTNPIKYTNQPKPGVEVILKSIQPKKKDETIKNNENNENNEKISNLFIEEEFDVFVNIINRTNSEEEISLSFLPEKMYPLVVSGNTVIQLGKIPPYSKIQAKFSLFPLKAGIFSIGQGICLKIYKSSKNESKVKIVGELAKVLIQSKPKI